MGSIVGWAGNYVTLDHCFSAGLSIETPVSTSKSFTAYGVGGLMGYGADSDTITSSYAGGKIKSEVLNTGGIVGRLSGTSEVSNVYAAMNVSTLHHQCGRYGGKQRRERWRSVTVSTPAA